MCTLEYLFSHRAPPSLCFQCSSFFKVFLPQLPLPLASLDASPSSLHLSSSTVFPGFSITRFSLDCVQKFPMGLPYPGFIPNPSPLRMKMWPDYASVLSLCLLGHGTKTRRLTAHQNKCLLRMKDTGAQMLHSSAKPSWAVPSELT